MNSPKISFNKNSQAWTFISFSEAFEFLNNKAISRGDLNYQEGSIKCIHYGDILTKFPQILDSSSPLLPYVNDDVDVENVSTLKTGDIVIADTAEDYAVGKSIEVSITGDSKVIAGLHTMSCRPKMNFASGFLGYYINSTAYHGQLRRLVTGTKVYAINKSEIRKTNLHFPCVEEQQKIAAFFTAFDEKICIVNKKLFQIELMKKAWIQHFMDKSKVNSDEWKNVLLKNICTSFSGGTPSTTNKKYYIGDIPLIRSGEIHSEKTELFISDAALKESSAKMVKKGDVLYALYGATSGECALSKIEGAINQAILCIRPKADGLIDPQFLVELLAFNKNKILARYLQGGQGNLSGQLVMGLELCIPSYSEQERFSLIVGEINKKTQLLKQKINCLNRQKKAFMQQMFV